MKVQNPIIGRSRGSAGGMTFCKNYDKNVARAKAFEVSNPNTPAQRNQRTFFKGVSVVTSMFTPDELRTLFPQKPKAMSRRNALSKQIAEDTTVVNNQKTVDFANIDTLGNAKTMDMGTTTCTLGQSGYDVTLDQVVSQNTVVSQNLFTAALVNESKGQIDLAPNCAVVSTGRLIVAKPSGWANGDSVHAIPLILNSKDDNIVLVGYGTMGVNIRPARK